MSRTCNFSQEGMVSPVLMIMLAEQSIENSYGQSIAIHLCSISRVARPASFYVEKMSLATRDSSIDCVTNIRCRRKISPQEMCPVHGIDRILVDTFS